MIQFYARDTLRTVEVLNPKFPLDLDYVLTVAIVSYNPILRYMYTV